MKLLNFKVLVLLGAVCLGHLLASPMTRVAVCLHDLIPLNKIFFLKLEEQQGEGCGYFRYR